MTTKPMVAVSVWDGAHDGNRFLIPRRSLRESAVVRFLGDLLTVGHDAQAGWTATCAAATTSDH